LDESLEVLDESPDALGGSRITMLRSVIPERVSVSGIQRLLAIHLSFWIPGSRRRGIERTP
jgi:hypothetical protein